MIIKNIVKNNSGDTVGYDIEQNGNTYYNININRLKGCILENAVYVDGRFPYIRGNKKLPTRRVEPETDYVYKKNSQKVKSKSSIVLLHKSSTSMSKGVLSKALYKVNNQVYLVKGNSKGHYEPIAEFIGSNLAYKILEPNKCVRVIKCKLMKSAKFNAIHNYDDFPYVSLCKHWGNHRTDTFIHYVDTRDTKVNNYYTWLINNGNDLLRKQVAIMLFIDAILGNRDRHLSNWDIDLDSNSIPALIDFGASCLSLSAKEITNGKIDGKSMYPDWSKPFEVTHLRQLELITSLKLTNDKIVMADPIDVIKSEFPKMQSIITEHTDRFDKYLDVLYKYLLFRAKVIKDKFKKHIV